MNTDTQTNRPSEQDRRFRVTFEQAGVGIAHVAPDGSWLAVNDKLCRIVGYRREELMAKTFQEITHTEDLARDLELHEQTLRGEITEYHLEKRYLHKDGATVWVLVTVTLVRKQDGEPDYFISVVEDISRRKQAETALRETSQRYQAALSTTKDGFWVVDHRGQLLEVNDAYCACSGYSREELVGMHVWELDARDAPDRVRDKIQQIADSGSAIFETSHRRKDGSIWPVEMSISYSAAQGGQFYSFARDITERREQEKIAQLRHQLAEIVYQGHQEQLLQTALDLAEEMTGSNIGFFHFVDKDQDAVSLQTWSTRTLKEMCYAKGEGLHYPVSEAGVWVDCIRQRQPVIHNDYPSLPHKQGMPEGHAPLSRELTVPVFREGLIVAVIGVGNKKTLYDDHDLSIVSRIADLSYDFIERRQAEKQIQFMAYNDVLTGLPNRQLFADRLNQATSLTRRSDTLLAVCYIDLDHFKPINDQYGHAVGDELLVQLARRLQKGLREGDTLARLGGDEFVLLISGLGTIYHGEEVVQRALDSIVQPFEIEGNRLHVSASVGVTFYPHDESDPDTLLRHADQAMYRAKESGKNTYRLFDPVQNQKVHAYRKALKEFGEALASEGQLKLYYQPRINLRTGELAGAEALLRWQHPEDGLLLPDRFLPVIDNSPLEIALGEWVIKQVLDQHLEWRNKGLTLPVSANITPRQIQQRGFPGFLRKLLSNYPPELASQLELEVLETSAIGDTQRVAEVMKSCAELGVTFSLDDFGTGYSSLTYFHSLPVHVLKIDQHFVRDMLVDVQDQDIVEGVLRLADALGRPVVAEGVENVELGMMLLQLGCEYAQGFGIARPMPADQIIDWAAEWRNNRPWHQLPQDSHDLTHRYDLDVAIFSHRRWIGQVREYLESGLTIDPPNLDSASCLFTRWYKGIGASRYGTRPVYAFILSKHNEVHEVALELEGMARTEGSATAMAGFDRLEARSDELAGMLRKLAENPEEV